MCYKQHINYVNTMRVAIAQNTDVKKSTIADLLYSAFQDETRHPPSRPNPGFKAQGRE